jgi:hypothetical protein
MNLGLSYISGIDDMLAEIAYMLNHCLGERFDACEILYRTYGEGLTLYWSSLIC